jgi:hypothetical protein
MTLLHLHLDETRERRPILARALFKRLGAALHLMHRAIIAARTRRMESELAFHRDERDEAPAPQDATRFPQRPLILGEKWDF